MAPPISAQVPDANPYGTSQGVTPAEGVPNDELRTHASPEDFGGQVGAAVSKLGDTGVDIGQHYAQMAAQAHADDIISNQLVPATTKISSDYYQLKGKAAVDAYQPTVDALNQVQQNAVKDLPPYQQNLVRSFSIRHITNLQDGLMRHQDDQMNQYEKNSSDAFIGAQGDIAVTAGSNPYVVNQSIQSAVGKSTLYAVHNEGIDPNDPQGKAIIDERSRQVTGQITQKVVEASILRGDINFANSIYQKNKDSIGGAQQVEIEKNLHAENQKYTDQGNVAAIMSGSPMPPPALGGMQSVDVKAGVVKAAQSRNLDPNVALMITGLESSFGHDGNPNVGNVKGLPTKTVEDGFNNQAIKQDEATKVANKMFNGAATPAQIYTVYQQGVGGGPALLKAAQETPNAKAVDVLSQFNTKDEPNYAYKALIGNGGNATMTAKQFTDMIQAKCDNMYGYVACNTAAPNGGQKDLAQAFIQPHQESGVTMQPTSNPLDALKQFEDNSATYYARANALPTIDSVNGAKKGLDEQRASLTKLADDYKNSQSAKIHDVTSLPDFYSLNDPRITQEMRTFMGRDDAAMKSANEMAKINREAAGKPDPTKYGSNYAQVQEDIVNHKLTTYSQLNDYMSKGMLNGDGVKQARKDIDDEYNIKERKAAAYAIIKAQTLGYSDNKGEAAVKLNTVMSMLPQLASDKDQAGISPIDYYDPKNKEFIGNAVKDISVPKAQSIIESATQAPKVRGVDDVLYDASKVQNDPVKLQKYMEEAKSLGWKPKPQVPVETK